MTEVSPQTAQCSPNSFLLPVFHANQGMDIITRSYLNQTKIACKINKEDSLKFMIKICILLVNTPPPHIYPCTVFTWCTYYLPITGGQCLQNVQRVSWTILGSCHMLNAYSPNYLTCRVVYASMKIVDIIIMVLLWISLESLKLNIWHDRKQMKGNCQPLRCALRVTRQGPLPCQENLCLTRLIVLQDWGHSVG